MRWVARKEARVTLLRSLEFVRYRRPLLARACLWWVGARGPVWFFGLYVVLFVVAVLGGDAALDVVSAVVGEKPEPTRGAVAEVVVRFDELAVQAQATVVGLVLPVALALVAILQSKRDNATLVRVFYREARAYEIAASHVALLVVLLVEQLLPLEASPAAVILVYLRMTWLVANSLSLWHFLRTCLDFVQPHGQQRLVRRYVANEAAPMEVSDRIAGAASQMPFEFGLVPKAWEREFRHGQADYGPAVQFGSLLFRDLGEQVIVDLPERPHVVVDIWWRPIRWVAARWMFRNRDVRVSRMNEATLNLPLHVGQRIRGGHTILSAVDPARGLTPIERFAVRVCYRIGTDD